MDYVQLGKTGLKVSRLCFGALTIGPLQANLSIDVGAEVIASALNKGVNFIDTAEIYGTYSHIKAAIDKTSITPVIATKTYAYDKAGAEQSLEKARSGCGLDVIDVFLLHEQESVHTIRGHMDALKFLCQAKERGIIRAVGISTHNIEVVKAATEMQEIDVIHPIVNRSGIGIGDGSIEEMLQAVKQAFLKGKGIYAMKPLGGGNLIGSYEESLNFVLDTPEVHSIALGMKSEQEVSANVEFFNTRQLDSATRLRLNEIERRLHIEFWCQGCEKCVERCSVNAIKLEDGKAKVDMSKCVLCGYCGSVCPAFAIKII